MEALFSFNTVLGMTFAHVVVLIVAVTAIQTNWMNRRMTDRQRLFRRAFMLVLLASVVSWAYHLIDGVASGWFDGSLHPTRATRPGFPFTLAWLFFALIGLWKLKFDD